MERQVVMTGELGGGWEGWGLSVLLIRAPFSTIVFGVCSH